MRVINKAAGEVRSCGMLMVSMFYGLDENLRQVGAQHGTDWSAVTSNTE